MLRNSCNLMEYSCCTFAQGDVNASPNRMLDLLHQVGKRIIGNLSQIAEPYLGFLFIYGNAQDMSRQMSKLDNLFSTFPKTNGTKNHRIVVSRFVEENSIRCLQETRVELDNDSLCDHNGLLLITCLTWIAQAMKDNIRHMYPNPEVELCMTNIIEAIEQIGRMIEAIMSPDKIENWSPLETLQVEFVEIQEEGLKTEAGNESCHVDSPAR